MESAYHSISLINTSFAFFHCAYLLLLDNISTIFRDSIIVHYFDKYLIYVIIYPIYVVEFRELIVLDFEFFAQLRNLGKKYLNITSHRLYGMELSV